VGSAVFFLCAPGMVAGFFPWLISRWSFGDPSTAVAAVRIAVGVALIAPGAYFLVRAFIRFVIEGNGTPAPVAAPDKLVVGGVYRYVRNPMYVAILTAITGQAVLFASVAVLGYGVGILVLFASFVRFYEQPNLTRRFGIDYEVYCQNVPAWLPRLRPWLGT
jgi:protein-S-isoprenylcysteine O-methyltransferase Ste14